MPFPPPPAAALTSRGSSALWANCAISASVRSAPCRPGTIGRPARSAASLAADLSPITAIASGGGPTHTESGRRAGRGQLGALGEEAVAGMNRLGARALGGADDLADIEI